MPLSPGQVLQNRYRIARLLGQGGFGAVYRAWDLHMNAGCAVKENFETSPEARYQFESEARLLFNLRHSSLPRVYDHFLIPNQGQYLVMDFIDGQNLLKMLELGGPGRSPWTPLPEAQALPWIIQVAEALSYMHRQSPPVIHRDIKPANIVITPRGQAVLVDFGIAKAYNPQSKTAQGARAITPGYSPIEQYGQGLTDARSDIYSLGATLYTLLTGVVPPEALLRLSQDSFGASITSDPHLSRNVAAVLNRALRLAPDQRYPDAEAFSVALQGAVQPMVANVYRPTQPVSAPSPPPAVVAQPAPQPAPQPASMPARVVKQKPKYAWLLVGLFAAVFVVVGIILAWNNKSNTPRHQDVQRTATVEDQIPKLTFTALPIVSTNETPNATQPVIIPSLTNVINTPAETAFSPTLTSTAIPMLPSPILGIGSQMTSEMDGMIQVYVPAGPFLMGSKSGEEGALFNEQPQRTVFLDAFWIDQTEVMNQKYALCVAAGACQPPSKIGSSTRANYYDEVEFRNFPVIYVSWDDADAYCRWVGRRLPSEAEWEKAARGTDGWIYPWGDQPPTSELANYNYFVGDTSEVGIFPSGVSPFGALDMAGNVYEWVADWYSRDFYQKGPSENPHGPASGDRRVTRGGSWTYGGERLRVAFRDYPRPSVEEPYIGFRCAASP